MKTYTSEAKQIEVAVGQRFTVELKAASGGGYRWEAQFTRGLLSQETSDFDERSGVGGSSIHRFVFEARSPGEGTLELTHKRPWEPAPLEHHEISVRVFEE